MRWVWWYRLGLVLLAVPNVLGRHSRPGVERSLFLAALALGFLISVVAALAGWRRGPNRTTAPGERA